MKQLPCQKLFILSLLLYTTVGLSGCKQTTQSNRPSSAIRFSRLDTFNASAESGSRVYVVGRFGQIYYRNEEAGREWKEVESGTAADLLGVSFSTVNAGWIVGQGGTVLHTENGGRTWSAQQTSVSTALMSVSFPSPSSGVAVGQFGTLLKTEDGGVHWRAVNPDWNRLLAGMSTSFGYSLIGAQPSLYKVWFSSVTTGWIVGEFGLVLRTVDGGNTWMRVHAGADAPRLYDILLTPTHEGWAVGQNGYAIYSNDGGGTWARVAMPTENDLYCIALGQESNILVTGGKGILLKSADDGAHWTVSSTVGLKGRSILDIVTASPRYLLLGTGGLLTTTEDE
jgi:photosystem II stability/assembly factor-like uncharacterized protein